MYARPSVARVGQDDNRTLHKAPGQRTARGQPTPPSPMRVVVTGLSLSVRFIGTWLSASLLLLSSYHHHHRRLLFGDCYVFHSLSAAQITIVDEYVVGVPTAVTGKHKRSSLQCARVVLSEIIVSIIYLFLFIFITSHRTGRGYFGQKQYLQRALGDKRSGTSGRNGINRGAGQGGSTSRASGGLRGPVVRRVVFNVSIPAVEIELGSSVRRQEELRQTVTID